MNTQTPNPATELHPLDRPLSFFATCLNTTPTAALSLAEIVRRIRSDEWRDAVGRVRDLLASGDDAGAAEAKKRLPAFTASGTFPKRGNAHLAAPSGIVVADLDKLDATEVTGAMDKARGDPHAVAAFTSPSGRGLKIAHFSTRPHAHAWQDMAAHVTRLYGHVPDPATKDLARLCFVSHDSTAHINGDALPLPEATAPPAAPAPAPAPRSAALDRTRLDEAKRRVGISTAANALGLGVLKPNGVQKSPFRPDRKPSFSVTSDQLWHDFSSGEGGDLVTFVQVALACTPAEAIKRVLAMAGLEADELPAPKLATPPPAKPAEPKRNALAGLTLYWPDGNDLGAIAANRQWPLTVGLEVARDRGLIWTANVSHRRETFWVWIFTDAARLTAHARRMDGGLFPGPDGAQFKSLSLRSEENHPIGLADITEHDRKNVLICEGEPDALAAHFLLWFSGKAATTGVLCVPGAARPLTAPVVAAMKGRRVRIFRQADPVGKDGTRPSHRAALAWQASLSAGGVTVDTMPLEDYDGVNGKPAKDLSDVMSNLTVGQLEWSCNILMEGLK